MENEINNTEAEDTGRQGPNDILQCYINMEYVLVHVLHSTQQQHTDI